MAELPLEIPQESLVFSTDEVRAEAIRLFDPLSKVGFDLPLCEEIAPLTLEILYWKRKRDAVILAHSYQTPDIVFGIADFKGDSYALSKYAQNVKEQLIVFCGVEFMAETAKILNPQKKVLLPSREAGCSLAESITAADVRELKEKFPGVPVVTYINTSAEVKA